MPRFVLLDHDHPRPHLDLMLEAEGVLWTWRLGREPVEGEVQQAERLADHRIAYLDHEGPVSGGRGTVSRRDAGTFEWVERGASRVEVELSGQRVRGRLVLVHRAGEEWETWLEAGSA
jgi:hypothetical protein